MSSESPRTIAIFGYGAIGKPIAQALAQQGATVLVFSRDSTKLQDVPHNAKVFSVDYTDAPALQKVLKEHAVNVVVSTLATSTFEGVAPGENTQLFVARAAKQAGAELFVPSEFGASTDGHTGEGLLAEKNDNAAQIKALGLPTVRIFSGVFMEYVPYFVSDPSKPGEFVIPGKGAAKLSVTAVSDIAGYVAHILTTLPYAQLRDSLHRLEGEALSLRDVAALYGKTPTFVGVEDVQHPLFRQLHAAFENGWGRSGFDIRNPGAGEAVVAERSRSARKLWPGHEWKTQKQAVPAL